MTKKVLPILLLALLLFLSACRSPIETPSGESSGSLSETSADFTPESAEAESTTDSRQYATEDYSGPAKIILKTDTYEIRQTMQREIKATDGTLMRTITYDRPYFTGGGNAAKAINAYYDAKEAEFRREVYDADRNSDFGMDFVNNYPFESFVKYEEKYNKNGFVSFLCDLTNPIAGSCYFGNIYSDTFDLQTGKRLTIKDVLSGNYVDAMMAEIPKNDPEVYAGYEDVGTVEYLRGNLADDDPRFYLADDGIHVIIANINYIGFDWDVLALPYSRSDVIKPPFAEQNP